MRDSRQNGESGSEDDSSSDSGSERLAMLVAGWIAAVVLLPLHALLIYNLFFTGSLFAMILMLAIFGSPLAVADYWAVRWFRDSFSVFRWTNRSHDSRNNPSARR